MSLRFERFPEVFNDFLEDLMIARDLERQPGWQGYATIEEKCAVDQK